MCIFTYGQTNSGKTYTMKGPPQDQGLVLRSLEGIFIKLAATLKCAFELNISYFEIYNEEVFDLLNPTANSEPLKVQYDKDKGVEIKGLTKQLVKTFGEAAKCYENGENKRKFAVTNMNHNSSRSHVLLQIGIRTKFVANPNKEYSAVLLMADLAGSESMENAGTSGQAQREGSLINKSLLALTTIITRLKSTQKKSGPLSYRDSKLTRVLQPVLTENSNTMVICTVSRDNAYITESMNTLRFGDCANKVKLRMRPLEMEKLSLSAREKKDPSSVDDADVSEQDDDREYIHRSAIKDLREEVIVLKEALEKKEIELNHQVSMYELQVEKTGLVELALSHKDAEIARLREDNRHMQRMMEIQEKNIVLSLEHSIKKRLLFEVRATYESEIGRLKTELIEAIESSTIPMEDKAVKKKLKILHERLACGEKESRDLRAKLSNKEEEIRKMKEELEVYREERFSKKLIRPMPMVSGAKKNTNQKLESSIERGPPQNSISREASRNRHRICCTPQSIAMIPTIRLGKLEDSSKVEGARIFNQDGELSRVVERSIKKNGEQLSNHGWAARNGNTFSFGATYSNRKPNYPEGDEPIYSHQKKEDTLSEPEIARHMYFDNISRSAVKNASSTGFLDSFNWGGKGTATEPQHTSHSNFFTSMVPESSGSSTNSTFKPLLPAIDEHSDSRTQQPSPNNHTIVPETQHEQMSLNERIELLRRPRH